MKVDNVFNEAMLNEMARADLKGAEKALMDKNWSKAAKIYVSNAKERDLDDKKIISGLGATFRTKKDSEEVSVGKNEAGEDILLSKDDVVEFKKAVKSALNFTPKADAKKKAKEEDGSKEKEPKADAEEEMPKTMEGKKVNSKKKVADGGTEKMESVQPKRKSERQIILESLERMKLKF